MGQGGLTLKNRSIIPTPNPFSPPREGKGGEKEKKKGRTGFRPRGDNFVSAVHLTLRPQSGEEKKKKKKRGRCKKEWETGVFYHLYRAGASRGKKKEGKKKKKKKGGKKEEGPDAGKDHYFSLLPPLALGRKKGGKKKGGRKKGGGRDFNRFFSSNTYPWGGGEKRKKREYKNPQNTIHSSTCTGRERGEKKKGGKGGGEGPL